ncbi:phosphoserine phosphatase SerB [Methanobrevibacter millerae]|uniref:phosphoserine phosphatase n=1 Tax=Methanobrevibacter millerae TaxID=230361 RepID=A0A1G5W7G4_9EURY|nr:phosphoserine phosphatase SerB [Methanobrevibacter millerae]SDA53686.1 phosphoserine phosphatase [Methanobrevibacter millerae]
MIKLVVFDLDNVIIDGEAIDEIGKLANVEDEIAEITEKAMQGEIDFETSIKDRVQLLEGTSIEEIEKVADELPLMPGACDTITCLKNKDVDVAIISGSFDVVAEKVKDKLGVDTVYTNSFTVEDGKLTGEVTGPLVSCSKLDVLNDHVEKAGISLEEVVAVGDGANDISMIESAGCGIAFNAKDSVKEIADIVVEEKDLTKVLDEILNQLTTEDTENDAVENEEAEEVEEAPEEAAAEEEAVEEVEATEDADEEAPEEEVEAEATEEEVEETPEEAAEEEAEEAETEATEEVKEVEAEEPQEDEAEAKKSKKDLPKSEFVLADTMEGVRKQKDEKEAEIAQIAEEREEYNRIAKEQRKIRDELNASLKENLNKAIEYRNERNEINKSVEEAKKARNDANNKIKSLEWSSGKRDKVKIENEIKKIDKIIETRVLDIKKENQLVKNANDLRKQLMDIQEDESVKEEAQELRKLSEEEHEKVITLSEQAQAAHEEMLTYFRKTDDIRTAADDAHKKFIEARNNASAKHEEFKAVLSDIHVINKKLGSGKPRKRRSDKKSSSGANKNREEKERAEEIFEKFKQGGKLSTEELLLLQKYNIN